MGITAWYFTTWQLMLRALYMPGLVMIYYWWLVPESIEWLYEKNKTDEIQKILYNMAKMNKRSLPDNFQVLLTKVRKQNPEF